jgi:hypothetical protein
VLLLLLLLLLQDEYDDEQQAGAAGEAAEAPAGGQAEAETEPELVPGSEEEQEEGSSCNDHCGSSNYPERCLAAEAKVQVCSSMASACHAACKHFCVGAQNDMVPAYKWHCIFSLTSYPSTHRGGGK